MMQHGELFIKSPFQPPRVQQQYEVLPVETIVGSSLLIACMQLNP